MSAEDLRDIEATRGARVGWRGLIHAALFLAWCGSLLALLFVWLLPIDPLEAPRFRRLELVATWIDSLRIYMAWALVFVVLAYLVMRRWRLLLVALGVAVAAGMPYMFQTLEFSAPVGPAKTVHVVSANLSRGRGAYAPLEAWCLENAAHVVLLLEVTPDYIASHQEQLLAHWPHHAEHPREDGFGMAVYSSIPLADVQWRFVEGVETPQLRLRLELEQGPLIIHGLHLLPPRRRLYVKHRREFRELVDVLRSERERTLVIGDFNFVGHGHMARVLEREGFLHLGPHRGTWPADLLGDWFPTITIDHAFAGQHTGLIVQSARAGPRIGSDHRPIVATVDLVKAE